MVLKNKKKERRAESDDSPQKQVPEAMDPKDSDPENSKQEIEEIQQLKEQIAAEKDRTLRVAAEFENFKKRKQRETDEFKKFANEMLFRQFLPVVDNLERAISAAEENPNETSLLEGVKLTHKEMFKLFESFNVKPVEAEHKLFDPNFHQAVTQEETDEFPENTVTKVLQKGYLLHDRLIRPAMVVVSKRAEKETEKVKEN